MNKYYGCIFLVLLGLVLSSCSTSVSAVQTAIAKTDALKPQEAKNPEPSNTPTSTSTPIPTNTPTNTQTPSPTFTITPTNTPTPLPIAERILGRWSGVMTNKLGDKLPAYWTFMKDEIMLVEFEGLGYSYGAKWRVEGNRLYITTELDPSNPTYRDVEFVTDDLMILTKTEANITETWTRVPDK
jgi:hypothetical protein